MTESTIRPAYRQSVQVVWRTMPLLLKIATAAIGMFVFFCIGAGVLEAPFLTNLAAGVLGAIGMLVLGTLNEARARHMRLKSEWYREYSGSPTFEQAVSFVWSSYLHRKAYRRSFGLVVAMLLAMVAVDLFSEVSLHSLVTSLLAAAVAYPLVVAIHIVDYARDVYTERGKAYDAEHTQ